jgi:hypothetical protein
MYCGQSYDSRQFTDSLLPIRLQQKIPLSDTRKTGRPAHCLSVIKNIAGGAAMITPTQANETVPNDNVVDQAGTTPPQEPQPVHPSAISFGVSLDSLLDEFERNTTEAETQATQTSIFTPSYGQPL